MATEYSYTGSEDYDEQDSLIDELYHELRILRKRLTSTEHAYRALETEYVQYRETTSLVVVLVNGLVYKRCYLSGGHAGGASAARDTLKHIKDTLVSSGDLEETKILLFWFPEPETSRDVIAGFSSQTNAFVMETGGVERMKDLVNTFLPLPQVRKIFVPLIEHKTSSLLSLPIPTTVDHFSTQIASANSSPLSRARSLSSMTSFSASSKDGHPVADTTVALSKIALMHTTFNDAEAKRALVEVQSVLDAEKGGADESPASDVHTLFGKAKCLDLFVSPPHEETEFTEVTRKAKPKAQPGAAETRAPRVMSWSSVAAAPPVVTVLPPSLGKPAGNADAAKDSQKKKEKVIVIEGPVAKLDRSKPMCKQIPPPCNQFYLTSRGCGNPKCQYGHNYQLKEADLQEMRFGASKAPCVYKRAGMPCLSGDDCVFGHVCTLKRCPQGDKCAFPPEMH